MEYSLKDEPNCLRLYKKLQRYFPYLFDKYSVRLTSHEDYEMFNGCSLVLELDSCKFWFETERGGVEFLVAPVDAVSRRQSSEEWFQPSKVSQFMENRPTEFAGFESKSRSESERLQRISEEFEPNCDSIIDFFRSGAYQERKEEFRQFVVDSRDEYAEQVKEYLAQRRSNHDTQSDEE